MAAHFLRLKLTLLANALRRSVWQTIGLIVAMLYTLFIILGATAGAIGGGLTDAEITGAVITIAGGVVVLGWWIVPLFVYGVDATLDPSRFSLYPMRIRTLETGLLVAGIVSIPAVATGLAGLGVSLAWLTDPVALVVAIIGALLALLICITGSRAVTSALAPLLESRRYREVVTIVGLVVLVLFGPLLSVTMAQLEDTTAGEGLTAAIELVAKVVGWTPMGAPWGLPALAHDGAWLSLIAHLAIALATLAVLWWVWGRCLARALVTPAASVDGGGRGRGLGLFGKLPASPMWAVAARCATYWLRDPRYSGSIAVVPLLPVILWFISSSIDPVVWLALAPFSAWMLGYSISSDLSYDYTALALHVSAGVSGRADRWGRVIPVLAGGGVVVMAFAVLSAGLYGYWSTLPAVLGLSIGVLLSSLGVSSAASAQWVYPVAKPGESPFKQQQGAAMATMVAQLLAMGIMFVLALPAIVLTVISIWAGIAWLGWVALVVGLAVGIAAMIIGVRIGARLYDRGAPDRLQKIMSFA